MNLHALRIFAEVAKCGSVTRSAENLLISQPAVTAQIRNLEKEIDLKLITANGRSIQLTEAGEILAVYSKQLFTLETKIEEEMQNIRNGVKGKLRICATDLPGSTVLPKWLVKFKKAYPMVDVQFSKGSSQTAYQRLQDHAVQLAFICGEAKEEEGIEYFTLLEDELIFIVPNNHHYNGKEISLEKMMKEPFILREQGSYTRKKLFSLCNASGIDMPLSQIGIEGMKESIEAVKAGYGAALVPALAVENELIKGELGRVNIKDLFIKHPIKLCKRKQDEPLSTATNFISFIKAELNL
ncbi:LysR family transcriptional regulator [Metabacillus niabensis]|uniref:DNA-binding transcriptional LysR family regulator n=1 Tax=Metabacillus niabensis TaxID=324854 RepID=A0ABT9Z0M7_9BACI|nr:LysR family transcriptional regulator [Metabacillus niabensis]MDQ0225803.1 DNA-binding transcriptional LysR family regulator [Metabacillus niabensis]